MKKRNVSRYLLLASALLASCASSDVDSSESSSSSEELKGDIGYRYLRADLIAFKDYDVFSTLSKHPNYSFGYKDATITRGLFGKDDPSFAWVNSDIAKISIDPESVSSVFSSLKSDSFKSLKIENHVQNAIISTENAGISALVFSGKECQFDNYLADGVLYCKPNDNARNFINWGMKLTLPKYGYDVSSYNFPDEGVKKTLSDESVSSIDHSGFLPVSESLSVLLPSLLERLLSSDAVITASYEQYAGKMRYAFDAKMKDIASDLKQMADSLKGMSSLIKTEEREKIQSFIDEDLLPMLETIKQSDLALRLRYNQEKILSAYVDFELQFDEDKMKEYILSREDVEVGSTSIPLSMRIKQDTSFDFDETQTVTFPDFSSYQEFEMPPKA